VVARGKKRKSSGEDRRAWLHRREGEGEQAQGWAQVGGQRGMPFRCAWRPLGTGGPTWQDEGRLAEVARVVGRAARRHVGREEGGTGLQQAREAAGGGGSRARGRDRGDRGPEEEDERALVTFKPVLNWRWAQKQKCRV
jgi:hypothetical protein